MDIEEIDYKKYAGYIFGCGVALNLFLFFILVVSIAFSWWTLFFFVSTIFLSNLILIYLASLCI